MGKQQGENRMIYMFKKNNLRPLLRCEKKTSLTCENTLVKKVNHKCWLLCHASG